MTAISSSWLPIAAASASLNWGDTNLIANPCDGWTGVLCDANGGISALELQNVQLGTLPASLFFLTSLTSLSLKGCGTFFIKKF